MDPVKLHRLLLDPHIYPDQPSSVGFCETHISRVYLTERFAYKVKKPLDLGFLDFSTLAKRRFFCQEELVLNRRFAPDTYLEVVRICYGKSGLRLGGPGRTIDYAVRMRRLPEERMLSRLLEANAPNLTVEMERLARHLAALLGQATPCPQEDQIDSVREKIAGNLRQTVSAIDLTLLAPAHALMATYMERQLQSLGELIDRRSREGFVRDGHGDLHAANICMTEPIRVYDCIEFCRRFRVADVAADLAFLLMDLDFRNRRDLATLFLDRYLQLSGDTDLPTLLPLYKAYRAWVRGKVATLLAMESEVEVDHRRHSLLEARRYFNLALGYHLTPVLILTVGVMGVGKSTLAGALAAATGATLLRSDVIRKELAGLPADRPGTEPFAAGLYSEAMTTRTYGELLAQAEQVLYAKGSVIVDAAFPHSRDRQAFLDLAARLGRPALFLHLTCPAATALARLDRRRELGNDPSDGRRELYAQHAASFAAFSPQMPVMEIDSSAEVDYNVQQALCQLLQL